MLHRFGFADGAVTYANRFLDTPAYRAARDTDTIAYSEFATDPCRTLFKRVATAFVPPAFGNNANVSVVRLGRGVPGDDRDAAAGGLRPADA